MANIMSMKNVRNKVHRNGFDLSFRNSFTAKVGELLPVMVKEVIPGDKFNINVSSFTRTMPLQTAAFTRLREYYDFYFVPLRLLWDKFPAFISQTDNPMHASSISGSADVSQQPYISASDMFEYFISWYKYQLADHSDSTSDVETAMGDYRSTKPYWYNSVGFSRMMCSFKLLQYLGYGDWLSTVRAAATDTGSGWALPQDLSLNPFPLLAYQKIYQDFFRFQQWERSAPYTWNLDYLMDSTDSQLKIGAFFDPLLSGDEREANNFFDLRYCNYKKDLFMGVLPSPQFGDTAVASPLTGRVTPYIGVKQGDGSQPAFPGYYPINFDNNFNSNVPSLQNTAGLSVFALRQAEFLQKWREITNSGNLDYREQLEKHWNVKTSRFQSDLCEYIGGSGANININEVVNQNLTSESDNANIAGKGVGSAGAKISRQFNEHGILMCIYHCEPVLDWAHVGIDRLNTKVSADSYAIPEFDSLGMELLPVTDLVFANGGNFDYLGSYHEIPGLGYVPRYIDYKTAVDVINGSFLTTMKDWVSPLTYNDIVSRFICNGLNNDDGVWSPERTAVSSETFRVSPSVVDSLFGVNANSSVDTDQLLIGSFFDCKVVRNLSTDGLPF